MIMMNFLEEISDFLGVKVELSKTLSGGSVLKTSHKKYFLKYKDKANSIFLKEVRGLNELRRTKAIDVISIVYATEYFILLDFIEPIPSKKNFFSDFGIKLAHMHRHTSPQCGFVEDNFLGRAPQINLNPKDLPWAEFFWEKRLLYQISIGAQKGCIDKQLEKKILSHKTSIHNLLNIKEPPSLLHGDLWNGNYLVNSQGEACLIDPAVYYGHREAELAMCKLFGGFSQDFYASYEKKWPLEKGSEKRLPIYQLYHILNHLNLFGQSYLQAVHEIVDSLDDL